MTIEQIYVAVSPIAQKVLRTSNFDSTFSMVATPAWDSLRHIQLLSAIEKEFGFEIDGQDAFKLTSAEKLVQYVHSRLGDGAQR